MFYAMLSRKMIRNQLVCKMSIKSLNTSEMDIFTKILFDAIINIYYRRVGVICLRKLF